MKIQTCCWLLVLAPFLAFSQGAQALPSFNSSNKQQTETETLELSGLSGKNKLALRFAEQDASLYLTLSGAGWGTATIDNGDKLMLLFTNDSVISLTSTSLQSIQPNVLLNTYEHRYALSRNDLEALSQFELTGIRKYSFGNFSDLDIPLKNVESLKRLSASFSTALNNADRAQPERNQMVKVTGSLIQHQQQNHVNRLHSRQLQRLPAEVQLPARVEQKTEETREAVFTASHQTKSADEENVPGQTAAGFPGGDAAFDLYLQQNLTHPEPLKNAEPHRVAVSFEIDAWGVCQNIRIEKSAGPLYDEEVRRALQRMPKWTPAMQHGLRFPSVVKRIITVGYRSS